MRFLFSAFLILTSCTSSPIKKSEHRPFIVPNILVDETPSRNTVQSTSEVFITPQDRWDYPGKFEPSTGEYVVSFSLTVNQISNCQGGIISEDLKSKLIDLTLDKSIIVEEYLNFLQIKLSPGEDLFFIKNKKQELAHHECLRLQNYLIKSFNFIRN